MVAGGKACRRKRGEDRKVIQAKEMMRAMHNALNVFQALEKAFNLPSGKRKDIKCIEKE